MIRHTLLLRRVIKLLLLFLIGKATCFAVSSGDASCAQDIRGGGAIIVSSIDEGTLSIIKQFLASSSEKNEKNNDFLIQGWRWHVMSLIRDAGRLKSLAEHLAKNKMSDDSSLDALVTAADFVVNFNMAGLYRVESAMFVKWLRKHLCRPDAFGDDSNAAATSNAYGNVIGKIEDQRIDCENLGKELYDKANAASSPSITLEQRRQHLHEIVRLSTRLSDELHSMRTLQETLIVPAISQIVSPSEQKSFNNKVLFNLGVLESRVHLVGMHDAVLESGSAFEREKFQKEIPYVARMMIERWRKSLYDPKGAWALDHISR
ncbi:hypothetical protein ACHAWC_000669 [Mediolabrus comicus]|jgi:hypothetical protein